MFDTAVLYNREMQIIACFQILSFKHGIKDIECDLVSLYRN